MKRYQVSGLTAAAVLVGMLSTSAMSAPEFYRYVDENGNVVITQALPPKMAKRGYQIVTAKGEVLRVVKPALSDEEFAALKAKELQAKLQQAADKELLVRFRSVEEIEEALTRRKNDITYRKNVHEANIAAFQDQLAEYNERASIEYERKQMDVPETIIKSARELEGDIADRRARLAILMKQLEEIELEYQGYIKRFNELKAMKKAKP